MELPDIYPVNKKANRKWKLMLGSEEKMEKHLEPYFMVCIIVCNCDLTIIMTIVAV